MQGRSTNGDLEKNGKKRERLIVFSFAEMVAQKIEGQMMGRSEELERNGHWLWCQKREK